MTKKRILGGSVALAIAIAGLVAVLVAGSVAVTPTVAEAFGSGTMCMPVSERAWGKGSSCAAALASLNSQAAGLCDTDCMFLDSCGAGPSVTNQTSCYFANGKWVIDADINNNCTVFVPFQQC